MAQARIAACLDACHGVGTDDLQALGLGWFEQLRDVLQRLITAVGQSVETHNRGAELSASDWAQLADLNREARAVFSHPSAAPREGDRLS